MDMIYLIGLTAVLASIVAARMVSESAVRNLNQTEMINLSGAFAGYKKFSLILILPLAFILWVIFTGNYTYYIHSVIVFFVFLVIYFTAAFVIARKKISSLGIDNKYLKKLFLSFAIRFAGIAVFCGIIIYKNIASNK